jgi:Ca2+-binding EF-hand superfamily protein
MKTTLLVVAIAAGMTLAASAQAREGHGPQMDMPDFEDLDINSDGAVTSDEIDAAMQARAAARFRETDTNGDGAVSAEEMVARADTARQERAASRAADQIEKADTNGDGLLQADEMAAHAADRGNNRGEREADRMFERADADDNGSLSAEEFAEARTRMEERGGRRPHGQRGDH